MLGTYSTTRPLPWASPLPRRRPLVDAGLSATGRKALRHGVRSALQTTCLAAAVMAAAGAVGASRGPIELSDPSQPSAQHLVVPAPPSAGLAGSAVTR
jgi:hypothetical protein